MKHLIWITLLIGSVSHAEGWFCQEESGKRDGNTIMACGVGDALNDEWTARRRSLDAAIKEFKTICDLSSDCAGKRVNVEPKRTSCVPGEIKGLIKCYRLIVITVLEE